MVGWLYEDFPEPYRSMGPNALHLPGRHFIFLEEDELAYERVLRAAFPGLAYEEPLTKEERHASEPPAYKETPTLGGFASKHPKFYLDSRRASVEVRRTEAGEWSATRRAWPYGVWNRSPEVRDWVSGRGRGSAPPNLAVSNLFFGCRKWIVEERRMAAKALRLIGKVGTKNYCGVKWPSMEVSRPAPGAGSLVIGHHAMAWLRSDPSHIANLRINSIYGNSGLRPGPEGED